MRIFKLNIFTIILLVLAMAFSSGCTKNVGEGGEGSDVESVIEEIIYIDGTESEAVDSDITGSISDNNESSKNSDDSSRLSSNNDSSKDSSNGNTDSSKNSSSSSAPTGTIISNNTQNGKDDNKVTKKIAFTFDDGPNSCVPSICDTFYRYSGKATFFVVGNYFLNQGDKATEYIKYAIDKGFEIGNHSMNHIKYTTLSQEEWLKEISDCDDIVRERTGYEMKLLRLPEIAKNDSIETTVKFQLKRPMLTGYGTTEGDNASSERIAKSIVDIAQDGKIILLHCREKTAAALDTILTELTIQGYEFVTVSELFGGTENIPLGYQVKEVNQSKIN